MMQYTIRSASRPRSNYRIRLFAASTAVFLSSFTGLLAQVTTATISGTVQDTANSVIPNAKVTIKNTLNGQTRTVQSDGAGLFSFPSIPTGDYQVTIEVAGFQNYTANGVHVDPGDQRSLRDIHLGAGGGPAENVTVTADTQINLDSGEISSLISAEQIAHLSVEGRDVTELFKTLPGFAIATTGTDNRAYDPSQVSVNGAAGSYSGNGTPLNGVAILTDGADVTDPGNFGAAIQNINYEFVAEVKAQTSSFSADTAHGPIVINAVGKSGGDHFHGSLYTYARTNQLNSNDWISNYTAQPQPPDRQVYPGFTFGGPVAIPGLDFNKSKHLTFFVGAEDYAQRNVYAYGSAGSAVLTALVPTAGMRTGDFSAAQLQQYLGQNYTPVGNGSACQNGTYAGVCAIPQQTPNGGAITNGQIPANFIDPGAQALYNTLPLPNQASNGTYNYITTNLTDNNLWEAHARVDDQISDKNRLFLVYTKEAGSSGVPQNEYYSARGTFGGTNLPGGGLLSTINSETGSFNLTTIVNAKLTNELYGQGAYLLQNFVAKDQSLFNSASIGYPYHGIYANGDVQYPTLEDYGNLPVNRTPDTSYGGIYAKKWIRGGGDNLTALFGAHTVRIGFFTELTNNNEVNAFQTPNGTISSTAFPFNAFTDPVAGLVHNTGPATANDAASTNVGNNLANFLEGHVATFTQQNINVHPDLYFWNISGYGQDHWRISPRLTLDIGLRLEHLTPFTDTRNDGVPVWDPTAYGSGVPTAAAPLPGFLWHGIDPSIPKGGLGTRAVFYEPRVGLAWDPRGTGLTVVRAGYGIYRAHDSFNDATEGIGTSEGQYLSTANYELLSTISATNLPIASGGGGAQNSSPSAFLRGDSEQPQVYTYNFAVDQKLALNSTLEISYVGNRSDHLLDSGANNGVYVDDQNALPIGALFGGNIPTNVGPATIAAGALSTAQQNAFRKYPFYTHIEAASHRLYSNFNALEVSWAKQQGKLNYSLNYTFSKALGSVGADGETSSPADPINVHNNYRALGFDRTHIFNANYSYDFGRLVKNRYIGGATNGWQISGITQIQAGQNAQDVISPNFGLGGGLGDPSVQPSAVTNVSAAALLGTPDYLLQPVLTCDPSIKTAPHQTINSACFALPARPGVNGQYVFPYIHAPAFTDTDLTATKNFKIAESQNVQLRIAAFNFINHANSSFNNSDVNGNETTLNLSNNTQTTQENSATLSPSTKNFGYSPLREGRRILELSLKYNF
ncbi:carboxypeptidase-like regulatory domain-containing protein [Acidipila sp. EB88]|uniref:TonB-dependent receptor n=1 Tax=Acidipila sp. EB88 TaxID=2305226 RepID=UPI00131578BF|nr:carboxypeptidase-like regulatory domain-containing protein [Acidipila sp. EB88]